jgi:ribosomal protein S9
MADKIYVGRRKNATARVILRSGSGVVTVNKREFEKYFPLKTNRDDVLLPMFLQMLVVVVLQVNLKLFA